jgi:hypothetical protein
VCGFGLRPSPHTPRLSQNINNSQNWGIFKRQKLMIIQTPLTDLIAPKPMGTQPRHLYRLLALRDPLLCFAALVVEADNLPVRELRVGHDEA